MNAIIDLLNQFTFDQIALYFMIVNGITYFLYWKDKRAAKFGNWRVPEASLLLFAFFGGTPGALFAQNTLRHKSKKRSYQSKLLVVFTAQLIIFGYLGFNWWLS